MARLPKIPEGYVRVSPVNDWEYITYYANGRRIAFEVGQNVRVRWPTGSLSTEKIALRERAASYTDHGVRGDVMQRLFGIEYRYRGVKGWVEITELHVREADLALVKPKPVDTGENWGTFGR